MIALPTLHVAAQHLGDVGWLLEGILEDILQSLHDLIVGTVLLGGFDDIVLLRRLIDSLERLLQFDRIDLCHVAFLIGRLEIWCVRAPIFESTLHPKDACIEP
jgi:hypothetical protein